MAGTDSGIGKTWTTAGLVRGLRARGVDVVGMKPVASGCEQTSQGLRNDDALTLLAASELPDSDYDRVNPVALLMPASPHIAAESAGAFVSLGEIEQAFTGLRKQHAGVLVEGVGGWAVPLSGPQGGWCMQADLVRRLQLPVILVVGLRLGCINHAVLTARAIEADGCHLAGWIGNEVEADWDQAEAVRASLAALLPVQSLGRISHGGMAPANVVQRVQACLRAPTPGPGPGPASAPVANGGTAGNGWVQPFDVGPVPGKFRVWG